MTDHPSALVSVPRADLERMEKKLRHGGWPTDAKADRTMLAAAPAAPQAAGVGEIAKACAVFQEAIDYFEADVADVMAEGSERADLWDREVTVNIDALKAVMNAALATREEAPADHHERNLTMTNDELIEQALSHPPMEAPAEAGERSVMVCPRCEGEGEYADGVDEAACSTPCTRCNGNGWLVDLEAFRAQPQAREDALRVAVEALEPFAYFAKHGTSREYINSDAPDDGLCAAASFPAGAYRGAVKALAAQPPASEDAQPVGWLRAADEEMVCAHLGVANAEDSYETAKKKLASLIQWNIAVATDPRVGGRPAPDALRVAVEASGFLLDRLKDLEQDVNERDFYGHVHPAASRLRKALAALQAEQGAK